MAFTFEPVAAARFLAWGALLLIGLWVWARRPDAAGRAFAFWAVVWAGGIQMTLSLLSLAADAGTQQVLSRASNDAILFSSGAFAALLLYVPRPQPRARRWLLPLLGLPALAALLFTANHGAFIAETIDATGYSASNTGGYAFLYHPILWTAFLGGMVWLGARAPAWHGAQRVSASWLMAGLALFAADRFARTALWYVRDPGTLGGAPEGPIYGLYMVGFGLAVAFMVARARRIPDGANVTVAALVGAAVGATAILSFSFGGATIGVLLSALLAPLYGLLLAEGTLTAPAAAHAAAGHREPVLAPLET